jgi:hypothetical protein
MVTIHRERGFEVILYPGDREHTPPHVYVFYGDEEVNIGLGDEDTAPWIREVLEMRKPNVRRALEIVGTPGELSLRPGGSTMARRWKAASGDPAEFDRQYAAAVEAGRAADAAEPRAAWATYDPSTKSVGVGLRGGVSFPFPTLCFAELADLDHAQLSELRATSSGFGLHWDSADVHLAVPNVVAALFGRIAAQQSGQAGGKSRSSAKAEAARRNARLGGRPATRTQARRSEEVVRVEARAGQRSRSVDVYVGSDYVVDPLNPAARRHRGRTGRVLGFEAAKDGRVRVQFHDTGRVALVAPHDLRPVERAAAD